VSFMPSGAKMFLITLFPQPICQNEERSLAQA